VLFFCLNDCVIALGQFAVRIKKERYMAPALKKDAAALWQAAGVRME